MGKHRKPDCYEIEKVRKDEILSASGVTREHSTNYGFYIEAQNNAFFSVYYTRKTVTVN